MKSKPFRFTHEIITEYRKGYNYLRRIGDKLEIVRLFNEVKQQNDREAQALAATYGVELSLAEIKALRPLMDYISFHWIVTGVPEWFINEVKAAIGNDRGEELLQLYHDSI